MITEDRSLATGPDLDATEQPDSRTATTNLLAGWPVVPWILPCIEDVEHVLRWEDLVPPGRSVIGDIPVQRLRRQQRLSWTPFQVTHPLQLRAVVVARRDAVTLLADLEVCHDAQAFPPWWALSGEAGGQRGWVVKWVGQSTANAGSAFEDFRARLRLHPDLHRTHTILRQPCERFHRLQVHLRSNRGGAGLSPLRLR
eukprot:COSAG06_NODE_6964_length_2694_cov_3.747206_4_plen_198_part_00